MAIVFTRPPRHALALTGLQATPMVPGVNLSYSNPQKPYGHIINGHTRTLFPDWPADSVVKITSNKPYFLNPMYGAVNALSLKCKGSRIAGGMNTYDKETAAILLVTGALGDTAYQSELWAGGDDKVYSSMTTIVNQYMGKKDVPPVDYWTVTTINYEIGPFGNVEDTSTSVAEQYAPSTSGSAFVDQSLIDDWFGTSGMSTAYASFSGEVGYADFFDDYFDAPTYEEQNVFSPRKDGDDPHGLEQYIIIPSFDIGPVASDFANLAPGAFFTYVLADTDAPLVFAQRYRSKARWHYAPDTERICGPCPYAGKTVTIEAKYKQAAVTRTITYDGAGELALTLGSWSDHSTQTFTLTLPDSLDAQYLDAEFDLPTSAGKVVALHDLRLVSIA